MENELTKDQQKAIDKLNAEYASRMQKILGLKTPIEEAPPAAPEELTVTRDESPDWVAYDVLRLNKGLTNSEAFKMIFGGELIRDDGNTYTYKIPEELKVCGIYNDKSWFVYTSKDDGKTKLDLLDNGGNSGYDIHGRVAVVEGGNSLPLEGMKMRVTEQVNQYAAEKKLPVGSITMGTYE